LFWASYEMTLASSGVVTMTETMEKAIATFLES
jgi:hypothetical protein